VAAARRAAAGAGLAREAQFLEGDAEALPLEDALADGAISECALCTFPDKRAAVSEIARALKPGARFALADMVAERERLPEKLRTLEAWISCFADARPHAEIAELLADAGLAPELVERHDDALVALLDRVEARLRAARAIRDHVPPGLLANVERGLELVGAARSAVGDGTLGYGVLVARRT
jgi:SAM-dependent methyltransferase